MGKGIWPNVLNVLESYHSVPLREREREKDRDGESDSERE
jgi:hypothetical protein